MVSYTLPPLEDSTRQIRLLRFLPTQDDVTIELTLEICEREHAPEYSAISYTWGPVVDAIVWIDGESFPVRENCWYALWQARLHKSNTRIWIDSICIDQADLVEKGHQVQRMWDIYSSAAEILSCLGPHEDNSEALLWMAGRMHEECKTSFAYEWAPKWVRKTLKREHREQLKRAYAQFAQRGYWSRLWIVQEIAAGFDRTSTKHRCRVLCGHDSMAFESLDLLELGFRTGPSALSTLLSLSTGPPVTLAVALRQFGGCSCADVRDRIYGLAHVIDTRYHPDPIIPDYTISRLELALKAISQMRNVREVREMFAVLEIDFEDSHMQQLIKQRLHEGGVTTAHFEWPTGTDQIVLNPVHCHQLISEELQDLNMCNKEVVDHTVRKFLRATDVSNLYEYKIFAQRNPEASFLDVVDAFDKVLLFGNNACAMLCHDTEPGDIIVHLGRESDEPLLVLREHGNVVRGWNGDDPWHNFDIVGQGFLLPYGGGDLWRTMLDDKDADERHFGACLVIRATKDDQMVLLAQDLSRGTEVDKGIARLARLLVKPLLSSNAVVGLSKSDALIGLQPTIRIIGELDAMERPR